MLRACALTNLGRPNEASRLFGRLCVLLPENTVCEALFRMTRDGETPGERLSLGLDVPRGEAMTRAMELIAALYVKPEELAQDKAKERALCRLSAWAFRSPVAGPQVATARSIRRVRARCCSTDSPTRRSATISRVESSRCSAKGRA